MRAIVTSGPGGPEVLRLGELPTPTPRPDEILVRVAAAGVNRADLMQRQGHYPPPPGMSEVIGLEVSGTVAAVGAQTTGWAEGDACVALLAGGGYAEYVAAPAGQLLPPPPGLDLVKAAGVPEVAATVLSNLDLADLRPGETILLHGGAGGIGSFGVQYAKALGAVVIATAGSPDKLDYCRQIGADHAIDYHGDWAADVRAATDGHGVDVVLDNMGARYLEAHVGLLAPYGRIVTIGMQGGRKGTLDLGRLLAVWGTVRATSLRARPTAEKARICAAVRDRVWPMLADGRIVLPPQTRFPLAEAAAAHTRLESGDSMGKLVLTVDG